MKIKNKKEPPLFEGDNFILLVFKADILVVVAKEFKLVFKLNHAFIEGLIIIDNLVTFN